MKKTTGVTLFKNNKTEWKIIRTIYFVSNIFYSKEKDGGYLKSLFSRQSSIKRVDELDFNQHSKPPIIFLPTHKYSNETTKFSKS